MGVAARCWPPWRLSIEVLAVKHDPLMVPEGVEHALRLFIEVIQGDRWRDRPRCPERPQMRLVEHEIIARHFADQIPEAHLPHSDFEQIHLRTEIVVDITDEVPGRSPASNTIHDFLGISGGFTPASFRQLAQYSESVVAHCSLPTPTSCFNQYANGV